jgi:hypothetical protein
VTFHFLLRTEKPGRVAAANMNSHFIDAFARALDIGSVKRCSAEGSLHESGSNASDRQCAQAHGATLLLCGDWRLSLIDL